MVHPGLSRCLHTLTWLSKIHSDLSRREFQRWSNLRCQMLSSRASYLPAKLNRHRRSRGSMGLGGKGINMMVGLLMMFARDGILQTTEGVSRFNLELGKDSITALGFSQKPGSAYPTCLHFQISITSSITTFLSLQPRGSSLDLARIPQHR